METRRAISRNIFETLKEMTWMHANQSLGTEPALTIKYSYKHMTCCGISLHHGSTLRRQIGILNPHGINKRF